MNGLDLSLIKHFYNSFLDNPVAFVQFVSILCLVAFLFWFMFKRKQLPEQSITSHDLTFESMKMTAHLLKEKADFETEIKELKSSLADISMRIEMLQNHNNQILLDNKNQQQIIKYIYELLSPNQQGQVDSHFPELHKLLKNYA